MVQISLTIKNMDKIVDRFKTAPATMQRELHKAVGLTVDRITRAAMREAPVNKAGGGGNLRQSIQGSMTGVASGKVEVGVKYAVFVHEGTQPHVIRPKVKKALANTKKGQFFGRVVNHPGTKANKFLERAIKNTEPEVNRYFQDAVTNTFKR